MSRCFPYPPPGYICNRATGDALIESIKIDKERERIKQEKKEQKRREKELKKKDRKDKKKRKENERLKSSDQITDGNLKRKRDCDGFKNSVEKINRVNSKQDCLQKQIEAEQLERSSLTEEYGQPIITESLCYSSDGTQSQTKKCKVEQSPTNENGTPQGKVIRFRLKKKEPESSTHPADETPSTSGRTEDSVPKVVEGLSVKDAEFVIPRPNEQLSFNVLPSVGQDCNTLLTNSMAPKKASKPKSAYESLFSGWVAQPIYLAAMEVDNDDDGNWLFHSKKRVSEDRASLNAYDGLTGQQSMSLQPRAHLLPEVDLYVLPYTLPF